MPAQIEVFIDKQQWEEVANALVGLEDKLREKALRKGIKAGLKAIEFTAKHYVPVDKGRLKEAIKTSTSKKKWGGIIGNVFVRAGKTKNDPAGAYYAHMVEFGTKNMSAQPYMRPAFELNSPAILQRMVQEIQKTIAKEWPPK